MPSFTNQISNMLQAGPIIEVVIGPSQLFVQAMTKRGLMVPQPVTAIAMIDTGASGTVVAPSVIQSLGLQPVGTTLMSTPSTMAPVTTSRYNVGLSFPNGVAMASILVIEAPLGGQHIQCLVGRDVLQHGVPTYIGYINQFTLSF